MQIQITISNLIINPCYNFLSYLYASNGWKRTIFDIAKENFIHSFIDGEKIRIVIFENRDVLFTAYCLADILKTLEYITEQFTYGRISNYLTSDLEHIKIVTKFTEKIEFEDNQIYRNILDSYNSHCINVKDNSLILSYNTYSEGLALRETLSNILKTNNTKNIENIENINKAEILKDANINTEITEISFNKIKNENKNGNIKRKNNNIKYEPPTKFLKMTEEPDNSPELYIFAALAVYCITQYFRF